MRKALLLCAASFAAFGCGGGDDKPDKPLPEARASLTLKSSAFADGGTIPQRYTCDGEEKSPPLSWSGVPGGTRELDLVVEDADAERFVHWTVLAIPAAQKDIGEDTVPPGAVETKNSFGKRGWGGPCPPEGSDPHRYVFALYATDAPLGLDADASADEVRSRLREQAVARGTLTARYGR